MNERGQNKIKIKKKLEEIDIIALSRGRTVKKKMWVSSEIRKYVPSLQWNHCSLKRKLGGGEKFKIRYSIKYFSIEELENKIK